MNDDEIIRAFDEFSFDDERTPEAVETAHYLAQEMERRQLSSKIFGIFEQAAKLAFMSNLEADEGGR